eukprot:Clim_evm17s217 gene=Clim_evmTU17s217
MATVMLALRRCRVRATGVFESQRRPASNITPNSLPAGLEVIRGAISKDQESTLWNELSNYANQYGQGSPNDEPHRRQIATIYKDEWKILTNAHSIAEDLDRKHNIFADGLDSGQINHYGPGGGCPYHVDAPSVGGVIAMLSLGSTVRLSLRKSPKDDNTPVPDTDVFKVEMHPGDIAILRDDVRWNYEHGIVGDDANMDEDRISLVFWSSKRAEKRSPLDRRRPATTRLVRKPSFAKPMI